jgi:hypothetical protein
MATIFETDTTFEMQKLIELNSLEGQLHSYRRELNWMKSVEDFLEISELVKMDEIRISGRTVINEIKKINALFNAIKNTKKIKAELVEKSLQMMYHPTRLARLLDAGLISFEEDGSFDNL